MSSPNIIPIDLVAETLRMKLAGASLALIAEHCYVRGQLDAVREENRNYRESPPHIFEALPEEMPRAVSRP